MDRLPKHTRATMGITLRLVTLVLVATIVFSATITLIEHHSNSQDNLLAPSTEFSRTLRLTSSPSLFPRSLDQTTYDPSPERLHERQVIEKRGWSKLQLGVFIAWMTAICLFTVWAVCYVCFLDLIKNKWRERRQPASEVVPV